MIRQAGRLSLYSSSVSFIKGIIHQIHKAGTAAALGGGGVGREPPFPTVRSCPCGRADRQIQSGRTRSTGRVTASVTENLLSEVAVVPQDTPVIQAR